MRHNPLTPSIEFTRKLGIKRGDTVAALDAPPFIDMLSPALYLMDVELLTSLQENVTPNVVLYWPQDPAEMAQTFVELRARIHPDGAVWTVIPKKPVADSRGPKVYFDALLAAALPTGLVDNKTLTFSQDEYGIRFVIRKELRKLKPWEQE